MFPLPKLRLICGGAAILLMAACGGGDLATRAASDPALFAAGSGAIAVDYAVKDINVTVPEHLKVSEANMYYPIADIVWRGDPRGDRYAQVDAILTDAFKSATSGMKAGVPVTIEAEVVRFHALTEKTRYMMGGTFSTKFMMTVRDARTGAIIDGPRLVVDDTKAAGGELALQEEARGLTQKIVVTQALAARIAMELRRPAVVSAPQGEAMAGL
jgi:hypothetical protein